MPRRYLLFSLFAIVAAAVCVRLGFWQLSRLHQRRARNAVVAARLSRPEVDVRALPADTATARFRRVRLVGRFDYAHEVVVMARTYQGSPGVNVVTPLRLAGPDSAGPAVLVNRGWAYSPNGATLALEQWREKPTTPDSLVTVDGFVDEISPRPSRFAGAASATAGGAGSRAMLWLDDREVARRAGYPIAPYVVLMQNPVSRALEDSLPARLEVPALDEGPHFSYALQWFSFAVIALGGLGIVLVGARGRSAPNVGAAPTSDTLPPPPSPPLPNARRTS